MMFMSLSIFFTPIDIDACIRHGDAGIEVVFDNRNGEEVAEDSVSLTDKGKPEEVVFPIQQDENLIKQTGFVLSDEANHDIQNYAFILLIFCMLCGILYHKKEEQEESMKER